jgi:hypothetical protein
MIYDPYLEGMRDLRDEIIRRQPSRQQRADVWREIADEVIAEYERQHEDE